MRQVKDKHANTLKTLECSNVPLKFSMISTYTHSVTAAYHSEMNVNWITEGINPCFNTFIHDKALRIHLQAQCPKPKASTGWDAPSVLICENLTQTWATWEERTQLPPWDCPVCLGHFLINGWCVRSQLTVDSTAFGQVNLGCLKKAKLRK